MTPTPEEPPELWKCGDCGKPNYAENKTCTNKECIGIRPSKEGPPTLRERREALRVLHSFYSRNVVDQRHLENVGHSKNILARLTDEALELDEKRTAALEELNKQASQAF